MIVSDLVSRVLAVIEEAECKALAVPEHLRRERWTHPGPWVMHGIESTSKDEVALVRMTGRQAEAIAEHIAHNDPAAVLRRCEAYRSVINRYDMLRERQRRFDESTAVGERRIVHTRITEVEGILECIAYGLGISVEEETTGE